MSDLTIRQIYLYVQSNCSPVLDIRLIKIVSRLIADNTLFPHRLTATRLVLARLPAAQNSLHDHKTCQQSSVATSYFSPL